MNNNKRILTLVLKGKWWHQINNGEKTEELRLVKDFWSKRLVGREYDEIHLRLGMTSDPEKNIVRKWKGCKVKTITHEEFGPEPVEVFAIDVSTEVSRGRE